MRSDRCANFYASAERATRKSGMLNGNTGESRGEMGFTSLRLSLTKLRTGYAKHQRSILRLTRTRARKRECERLQNIRSGRERRIHRLSINIDISRTGLGSNKPRKRAHARERGREREGERERERERESEREREGERYRLGSPKVLKHERSDKWSKWNK